MIKETLTQWPYCWHQWYAWRPIWIWDFPTPCMHRSRMIWLETIWRQRRDSYCGDYWEYSLEKPTDN